MCLIKEYGGVKVMNLTDSSVKIARREMGVSHHVPITHFNVPTILESKTGALFSVIKFSGVPFETEKTEIINSASSGWHRALSALDERFALLGTLHRRKVSCELKGEFNNKFAKQVDQAYQSQFIDKSLYVNDLYVAVIFKGLTTGKVGRLSDLLCRVNERYIKDARTARREINMKQLNDAIFQLTTSLSEFGPHVLGSHDDALGYSGLLAYVSLFVNGGETLSFKNNSSAFASDKTFEKTKRAVSIYPQGHIAQVITAKRIFFGDFIQFQGALPKETRFAAMVSVKRYGAESASIMLDPLLHLDGEFIATQSFLFESKTEVDKKMDRQGNKMQNANDPATSQIEALATARDDLASDHIAMGYHHNTVMILSDSIQDLERLIAQTIKCYMNAGIVAVRETLGQEPAFWSQIPTNFKYIARSSLISSKNFTDFFPLHNYRTGFMDANHLGSAMMLIETPSKTPLWLNLHAKGPKDNPSPGHTTLIGGNGSGKTVAMCCFDAQLNRYGGSSFFFDRNRGAEIYIRACEGHYAVLSPDHAEEIHFNPLQLADTATNRKFCKDWLIQLVKKEHETEIDERIADQLGQCVDYAYEQLAPEHRHLTHASKILPISFDRWIRLRRWLRGDKGRPDGEYAYLFDNEFDALNLQNKMGFDMTHFLDHEPPSVLAALTMYLMHRIELSLKKDGRLVSIFLDEAWQYLDNGYWQTKLKKWLPTLRKLNCHLIFATQSPRSVVSSPIKHMILDNCATNIYFANPQAKPEDYIDGFNLSPEEFNCIKENEIQSRLFLYKQGHESALARLNLGHLKDLLKIMSGTQASVDLLTKIRKEAGDHPKDWLPLFLGRSHML